MKDILMKASIDVSNVAYTLKTKLVEFGKKQDGVTAIEYAVIAVAVSVMLMSIFGDNGSFVTALKAKFADVTNAIKSSTPKK